jgi:hypothetical protein
MVGAVRTVLIPVPRRRRHPRALSKFGVPITKITSEARRVVWHTVSRLGMTTTTIILFSRAPVKPITNFFRHLDAGF